MTSIQCNLKYTLCFFVLVLYINSAVAQGISADTELAQRMLRRGDTYSQLERHEEAIVEYRKAIAADQNLADAYRGLANTFLSLDRPDEARPLLKTYIKLAEQQRIEEAPLLAANALLGNMEREAGNYSQALAIDLRTIELDPENDSQVHIMANTYNNAGEAQSAIEIYSAAEQTMPSNAFISRSLGRILEAEGELERALEAYQRALSKEPDSDFYQNLVDSLQRRIDR